MQTLAAASTSNGSRGTAAASQADSGTLLSYRAGGHVFFLYGFAKNQRANIDDDEETTLKRMGKALGAYTQQALDFAVANGDLEEVSDGAEENDESGA